MSMDQLMKRVNKLLKAKKSEEKQSIVYKIFYDEETGTTWQSRVFEHGGQRVILCLPEIDA